MKRENGINRYVDILKVNLRHQYPGPVLVAVTILMLTGLLFNINALEGTAVTKPLEMLVIWTGPALLVPVFLPEQNPEIRDVVRVKSIDYFLICILRILYSALTVAVLSAIFTGIMRICESRVLPYHLWGCICSALLLGAVGLSAAGISGNAAVGYMVCMLYFLASYGLKNKLSVFNLFSMTAGSMTGKGWQLLTAILIIVLTFLILKRKE